MSMAQMKEATQLIDSGLGYVGLESVPHELVRSPLDDSLALRFWVSVECRKLQGHMDVMELIKPMIDGIKNSPLVRDVEKERDALKEKLASTQAQLQELACYVRVARSIQHNLPIRSIQI